MISQIRRDLDRRMRWLRFRASIWWSLWKRRQARRVIRHSWSAWR